MKSILLIFTICIVITLIKSDDSDKEENRKLIKLAKILVDRAAVNKINYLISENESSKNSYLVNYFLSNLSLKINKLMNKMIAKSFNIKSKSKK
jgi:hypothetical protein